MNEKLEILGLEIDNLSVSESMDYVKEFLQTDALSIVGVITTGMLIEAEKSEEYREIIEQLNLSIVGDKEILQAAGEAREERFAEIQENRFMKVFFKYLIEQEKQVVLLMKKMDEKNVFVDYVEKKYPFLKVSEVSILEEADEDNSLNLINGASADIIVSILPSPYQEEFVFRNRQKLGAKLWIGLGKEVLYGNQIELKPGFWGRMMEKRVLKKKVSRYQNEKGE